MENTWLKLPRGVQFMVLKRLSRTDLRILQFSCKYFYSLLSDLQFLIEYGENRTSHASSLYRQIPRTFWEFGVVIDHLWTLIAYGDGLLCYQTFVRPSTMERMFLVFNPRFPGESDRCILRAPATDCSGGSVSEIAGIAFDRKKGMSKLVLCQKSIPFAYDCDRTTFVYNFKELTWKKIAESKEINNKVQIGPPLDANAQIVNERLLCWLMEGKRELSIPYMVLLFDLEEEAWLDPIPVGNELFVPVCIAEHENEVCLIGRTSGMMELRVWKVDKLLKIFRPDEYIPAPPSSLWKRHDLLGGRGAFMWITRFHSEEDDEGGNVEIQRVWVYEISRHSWKDLGTLSFTTQYEYGEGEIIGICFEHTLFRLL